MYRRRTRNGTTLNSESPRRMHLKETKLSPRTTQTRRLVNQATSSGSVHVSAQHTSSPMISSLRLSSVGRTRLPRSHIQPLPRTPIGRTTNLLQLLNHRDLSQEHPTHIERTIPSFQPVARPSRLSSPNSSRRSRLPTLPPPTPLLHRQPRQPPEIPNRRTQQQLLASQP